MAQGYEFEKGNDNADDNEISFCIRRDDMGNTAMEATARELTNMSLTIFSLTVFVRMTKSFKRALAPEFIFEAQCWLDGDQQKCESQETKWCHRFIYLTFQ